MTEQEEFRDLLLRVRAGEGDAATELVRRYEPEIRRAVHMRLSDPRLRRVLETMDICQSVFARFFVPAALGELDLQHPRDLLNLLITMAFNKVTDHARRETADKRDQRRTVAGNNEALQAISAGDPSPSRIVAGKEMLLKVRERLSEDERWLADQRALGREWAELAAERNMAPDALRMSFRRALTRVMREMGLENPFSD